MPAAQKLLSVTTRFMLLMPLAEKDWRVLFYTLGALPAVHKPPLGARSA